MVAGQQKAPYRIQSSRGILRYADVFRLAGQAGLLDDPERAVSRMTSFGQKRTVQMAHAVVENTLQKFTVVGGRVAYSRYWSDVGHKASCRTTLAWRSMMGVRRDYPLGRLNFTRRILVLRPFKMGF